MERMIYKVIHQAGDVSRNPVYDVHITRKLRQTFQQFGITLGQDLGVNKELGIEILRYYEIE